MNGEGFSSKVKAGQKVSRGEALLKMDIDKIHQAGYKATVVTVITDPEKDVEVIGNGTIQPGQDLLKIS